VHDCPTCGQPTTEGDYCIRCGAPQAQELTHSRERQEFAAAPGERRYAPWLVSTLFPRLPKHSERHFHIALGVGIALVCVLGALRLFPVALISAALLLPLLTVLYFYDVDVYEGEPMWAAAWTVLWGALTGVGVGLLAKALSPSGPSLIDKGSTAHVVTGGILLPALGVVVTLAGPMMLFRDRRFNETLDGAAFGACAAAMFAAAEAVVVGVGVLGGGLRPAGATAPWVARLVAIAIATPVLSMSAVGAACAAVWLRYRAPVSDRRALGALGSPIVAIVLAVLLVIAGAIGETFMSAGIWLVWLVTLDLVGLELLRRALHVGLLEESAEREIGPGVRCANCGAMTSTHTFCSNCGIALDALPKVRSGADADDADPTGRGGSSGRLTGKLRGGRRSGRRRLLVYGAALTAIVAVAFGVGALAAPPAPQPKCGRGVQCGSPPIQARAVVAFPGYTLWRSQGLGYSLRYNSSDWQVASQSANAVELQSADGSSLLSFDAQPEGQTSPAALIDRNISSLQSQLLGLAQDSNPSDQLLGTNLGLTSGPGGIYTATISSPQGPQSPVAVAVMAAGKQGVSIAGTVITPADNAHERATAYQQADDIINSIQWSGQ
jgi:ribosomal protein L32